MEERGEDGERRSGGRHLRHQEGGGRADGGLPKLARQPPDLGLGGWGKGRGG